MPLLAVTLVIRLYFAWVDPFVRTGADVLEQARAQDGAARSLPEAGWSVSGPGVSWAVAARGGDGPLRSVLQVDADHGPSSATLRVPAFASDECLSVEAHARAENVVPGSPGWRTARVILYYSGTDGTPRWDLQHEVCAVEGSRSWRPCRKTLCGPPGAGAAYVAVANLATGGTLFVDELAIYPAQRSGWTAWWSFFLGLSWVGALLHAARWVRPWRGAWSRIAAVLVVLIGTGCVVPESMLQEASSRIFGSARALLARVASTSSWPSRAPAPSRAATSPPGGTARQAPAPPSGSSADRPGPAPPAGAGGPERAPRPAAANSAMTAAETAGLLMTLKKAGHGILFAILGMVAVLDAAGAARTRGLHAFGLPVLTVVGLLLFAVSTEVLQYTTLSRVPSVRDWLVDAAGIVAGGAVAGTAIYIRSRLASRIENSKGRP